MTTPTKDPSKIVEVTEPALAQLLHELRRREVQAIGAAISTRSWHAVEHAYNSLRDKMDRAGAWHGAAHRIEASGELERLREALKPFANKRMPARCDGNAAFYSLLHTEILAARAALETPAEKGGR